MIGIIVVVSFLLLFLLVWILCYYISNKSIESYTENKEQIKKGKECMKNACSKSTYAKITRIYSRSYPNHFDNESFSYVYNFFVDGKKYSFIKYESYHSGLFNWFIKYKVWYNHDNPNICYIDRSFKETLKRLVMTIIVIIGFLIFSMIFFFIFFNIIKLF